MACAIIRGIRVWTLNTLLMDSFPYHTHFNHYTFKSVTDRNHFDHCGVLCEITAISMTDIGRQIHRSVKRGLRLHKETLSLLSSTIMLPI